MPQPSESSNRKTGAAARLSTKAGRLIGTHRTAILALATRAVAVIAGFAVTWLIGRNFGAAATGQYALVVQTATLLAVVGLLGLDVSVVRHFARAIAEGKRLASKVLLRVLGLGFAMLAIVVLAVTAGGQALWDLLFDDIVGPGMLLVLCLLVLGRGGAQLLGGLLRSQHRFNLSLACTTFFIPAATAVGLIGGWVHDVEGALWAATAGGLLAILIGLFVISRHTGRGEGAIGFPMKAILASSLPLWGVGLAQVLGDWYGLAVAGHTLGATGAGLFRVSVQFATMLQMLSSTLYSVYSAQISTAFHAGRRDEAARLARTAVWVGTLLALPLTLVLLFGGPDILGLIGPEFTAAYPVMVILIVGQLALALTGPCGLVLAMSGNERVNLYITLIGTLVLLASVPLAASYGGLEGIAVCISVVMLVRNLVAYYFVQQQLRISIWAGTAMPAKDGTE